MTGSRATTVNIALTVHIFTEKQSRQSNKLMRGSRKFCQRGSNFDNVFLVDEGREDPNATISVLSLTRQRNTIDMADQWWPVTCMLFIYFIFCLLSFC